MDWYSGGSEDGQYIYEGEDGSLVLENFITGDSEVFVPADQIPSGYYDYFIRPDQSQVLFATNYTQQYRHSYFADYFVYDIAGAETVPLVEDQAGDIQYATWAPSGDVIAFVRGNDIYVYNNTEISQVTNDGGPDMFNGIPDWVYEEEIFGDRYTLWFSPDGSYIAYLSFNESGVGTFTIPYYMDGMEVAPQYPAELDLRYPKVGTTNPTVQFNLLDMSKLEIQQIPTTAFEPNNTIIGEVAWVTEGHDTVLYRVYNRVQDRERIVNVDVEAGMSSVVRERDATDGWLDNNQAIQYVGPVSGGSSPKSYGSGHKGGSPGNTTYYVDLSDQDGWAHLYLYPVSGGEPIQLTSGEWEVASILSIDSSRNLIYYSSTEHHSTERHIYSVNYETSEKTALVDDHVAAYWSASFSGQSTYYLLSYLGPDVPYQELYSINDTSTPIRTVTNNTALVEAIAEYDLPEISYFELDHPDGYSLNVMERLPANFDESKSYPVLFTPYGGPGAQQVSKRFQSLGWNAYIASDPELEYITYTVDNRGTGYKGRDFRATVTRQLGYLEPRDQVWAAEQLREQDFVNSDHISMWGWSFGGYLTAKVLELDSGVFSMGLITAPVTDWRFYDSMYTERYQKLLSENEAGYNLTAVRDATGFKNAAGGFAIYHGTGDDNVHYQNTAALVDLLVGAEVSPEQMSMVAFTDSAHSLQYNGAPTYHYKALTRRLYLERNREVGGEEVHQWSRKAEEDRAFGGAVVLDARPK